MCAGQPPQLVAVPTHFYKVILGEGPQAAPGSSPDTVVAAFVLPNQPIEPGAPLTAFAVPVSALEEVSGAAPALQLAKSRVEAEFRVQVCRAKMSKAGTDRLLQLRPSCRTTLQSRETCRQMALVWLAGGSPAACPADTIGTVLFFMPLHAPALVVSCGDSCSEPVVSQMVEHDS